MLLDDDEIKERIESPINLLNRLKTSLNRSVNKVQSPSLPPKAEDIVTDLEDKLKGASSKNKANSILLSAMTELERRLPEVQKPETLSRIAAEMSRVVSNQEAKHPGSVHNSQIIVYAPQVQSLENFEVIDIQE